MVEQQLATVEKELITQTEISAALTFERDSMRAELNIANQQNLNRERT